MLLELGFIIPLAGQPEQCYNAITPNDMNTSTLCAFSGVNYTFPRSTPHLPFHYLQKTALTQFPRPSQLSAA